MPSAFNCRAICVGQRLLWYVQIFEKRFAQEQAERLGVQQRKELSAKRLELEKSKQRISEIDPLGWPAAVLAKLLDQRKGFPADDRRMGVREYLPILLGPREQAYFFCSNYRKNTENCTIHYIRESVIEKLVLEGLQRLLWYVQIFEKRFAQEQAERLGVISSGSGAHHKPIAL